MFALVIALTTLAALDEPTPPADAPPADAPPAIAPQADAPAAAADTTACKVLLRAGNKTEAAACFRAAGAANLVDVVAALELSEPLLRVLPPVDRLAIGGLVSSGKAEMIGVSTLAGAYVAVLGVATIFYAGDANQTSGSGTSETALLLLAPVVGGGLALGASTAAVLAAPQITAGDANIIRACILLGGVDSALVPFDQYALRGDAFNPRPFGAFETFMMGGVVVASAAGGVALAAGTDLPESAGSLAVSSGLWTTVLVLLAAEMGQTFKQRPEEAAYYITVAANAGFVGGLVASPYLPMTRAETWAIDVGGGVGLAAGASVATFAHAPNPFLGWGAMFIGTSVGMASGFAAARYLPDAFGALPEFVAVAPLALPDNSHASVVYGGVLLGRF